MMEHELKTWPHEWDAIRDGRKRFEVRSNRDRSFGVGDVLVLRKWCPDAESIPTHGAVGYYIMDTPSGNIPTVHVRDAATIRMRVTYILHGGRFGLPEGVCCMSIEPEPTPLTDALSALTRIRAAGWSVAVHNDYRMTGRAMTFWAFTHPSGVWVKGEGYSDAEALAQVEEFIRENEECLRVAGQEWSVKRAVSAAARGLLAAVGKVPILRRSTNDAPPWSTCIGCKAEDGDPCQSGCWVSALECAAADLRVALDTPPANPTPEPKP